MTAKQEKQQRETDEERAKYGLTKDAPTSIVQTEFGTGNQGNMGGMAQFEMTNAKLKAAIADDGEFVIISRRFQGEDPVIMSSGDQAQTRQMFEQVARTYAWQELTPA